MCHLDIAILLAVPVKPQHDQTILLTSRVSFMRWKQLKGIRAGGDRPKPLLPEWHVRVLMMAGSNAS